MPDRDETAARIVETAARIIDEDGLARLTHRAVAERAGLTLGTVSHKFRTKPALLEAAFEGLYRANVERLQAEAPHATRFAPPTSRTTLPRWCCAAATRGAATNFSSPPRAMLLCASSAPSCATCAAALRAVRCRILSAQGGRSALPRPPCSPAS
ncbi:TetR/AcrR family transcriptional regulator [Novosphingobium resinovorum]